MPPTVRPARTSDAAAVARLCVELGYPTTPEQASERLAYLATTADHAVFVAEAADSQVLGWVHVSAFRTVELGPSAQLAGLVVAADARGTGVGRVLVDAAEAWALRQGLPRIFLSSRVTRESAHRFYRHLGYRTTKTSLYFEKSLIPASGD